MLVGELFVNMGMIGGDALAKGLSAANKSLNQIKETGLESAFRLKNVFGQFEEQVSTFSNMGTVLKVFEDQTGLSAVTLQKFQRAFMGVNVSADETRATMLNLQNIMNTIQRGGAVPAAMSEALKRANVDVHNIKDIYGFADKLFNVSKSMDVGVGRDIFKDLGISGTAYQGFRDYQGNIQKERAWMSESQTRASAKMNAKVNLMKTDIESGFAKLLMTPSASKALDVIYKVSMAFISLLNTLLKFADKTGILDILEKFLILIGDLLQSLMIIISNALDKGAKASGKKGANPIEEMLDNLLPGGKLLKAVTGGGLMDLYGKEVGFVKGLAKSTSPSSGNTTTMNVTQNITAPDPHTAGKKSKEGMTNVMKNISDPRKK